MKYSLHELGSSFLDKVFTLHCEVSFKILNAVEAWIALTVVAASDTITVDSVVLLMVAGATPPDVRCGAYSLDDDIFFKWNVHHFLRTTCVLSKYGS